MRLGRIASPDGVAFVSIEGEPDDMTAREIAEHPFGTPTFTGRSWPLADVRLLAPMLASKVVCIGKNYADHIAEMGGRRPTGRSGDLPQTQHRDHRTECADSIAGQRIAGAFRGRAGGGRSVGPARTSRPSGQPRASWATRSPTTCRLAINRQADGQWTRAKGHDTFCPVGPWIVTDVDPADLELRTEVNGEVKQDSRTSLMIHDVGAIVEWVSAVMTLLPGDLILTGTPAGVGPIEDGDTVSITITGHRDAVESRCAETNS